MELVASQVCQACASKLCDVRELVRAACAELGYTKSDSDSITLAIDEACANVVRHAYEGRDDGRMVLEIYRDQQDCVFHLRDDAKPCSGLAGKLEALNLGAEPDKDLLSPGGLGLALIHQVMDSVALLPCSKSPAQATVEVKGATEERATTEEKGNLLELRKKLPQ